MPEINMFERDFYYEKTTPKFGQYWFRKNN